MSKTFIFLFALFFLASCNMHNPTQNSNNSNHQAEDTRWSLVEFNGKPVPPSVAGKVHILLSADGTKLSGSDGCNNIMGTYAISNATQLSFSQMASTRMACQTEGWNAAAFHQMLETVNKFTVSDHQFILHGKPGTPLAVFVKAHQNNIVNKYWKLIELQGQKVNMADDQEGEQYFIMRDDGTINGFAGCNRFSGSYTLDSQALRVKYSNVLSTVRACPEVKIDESAFLNVFNLADHYTLAEDRLSLNTGKRAPLAVFEAVYF